jgi:ribonucleoside-triphosphate reductase
MDTIFINLPRIAYEAKKNDERFLALLRETVALTVEGFKVKKRFISERFKQPLLPILSGNSTSGPYFYEKNASYNLAFVGLSEAVEAHTGARVDKTAGDFGLKLLQDTSRQLKTASQEGEMRLTISQRPADEAVERLAELDVQQFGRSVMVPDSGRGPIFYTDLPTLPLSMNASLESRITIETKFQSATPGGHLNVICISGESRPIDLLNLTERALGAGCKFLTYSSNYSTCNICGRTDIGINPKCNQCGSYRLTYLGRASYGLLPFSLWPEAKRKSVDDRVVYTVGTSNMAA